MDRCKEKHKQVDEKFNTHENRLNIHGDRLDVVEQKIIAQEKDTTHLQDAMKALKTSIDLLIEEIGKLKSKPLEKYEKIGMVVISAVIGYLVSKIF